MVAAIFSTVSMLAIVAGGVLSAFSARRSTWSTAWASAYLVLVVGVIQFGLAALWHRLGQPGIAAALAAFLVFNLGNGAVMAGTLQKKRLPYYRTLVNGGGFLIALAMALLLMAVRNTRGSLVLAEFIILVAVILVSMPTGLVLSGRRHKRMGHNNQPATGEN